MWQRRKLFGDEMTGTEIVNPKPLLGSSLGGDVWFRDNLR